jgi:hypothetical protein
MKSCGAPDWLVVGDWLCIARIAEHLDETDHDRWVCAW